VSEAAFAAPRWLVSYSLGPVQEFIAASRKMRDLWVGSALLSELSAAAIAHVRASGRAEIVMPSWSAAHVAAGATAGGIPNRGVFLWTGDDPTELVATTGEAVQAALEKRATNVAGQVGANLLRDRWGHQLKDLIDFRAGWARCDQPDDASAYQRAYVEASAWLLARKRTAWFEAEMDTPAGTPSSSLDAARPSVLDGSLVYGTDRQAAAKRRSLRLDRGEALDAPGLIKRVATIGGTDFPSLTRIALAPWVASLTDTQCEELRKAYSAEALIDEDLVSRSWEPPTKTARFPWEGQLLLADRIGQELARQTQTKVKDSLKKLKEVVRPLPGRPRPFIALLALDIDRFGKRLHAADRAGQTALAKLAADFSDRLLACVKSHLGVCLYAGGDEALAVLPVSKATKAAASIGAAFADCVAAANLAGELPTLSAGLFVAHALTPMGTLRAEALQALSLAKRGRSPLDARGNALAVAVQPRRGGLVQVRGAWAGSNANCNDALVTRLDAWVKAYTSGRLAMSAPHLLADQFGTCGGDTVLQAAHWRRFVRRRQGTDGVTPNWADIGTHYLQRQLKGAANAGNDAESLLQELLVARWLAGEAGDAPLLSAAGDSPEALTEGESQ
jgi:CRISPR-associated protein Cmr2